MRARRVCQNEGRKKRDIEMKLRFLYIAYRVFHYYQACRGNPEKMYCCSAAMSSNMSALPNKIIKKVFIHLIPR